MKKTSYTPNPNWSKITQKTRICVMASQARENLGKEIAESVLYIRFISHRALGKPPKQIFGKSWDFGPTGLAPPPSPQTLGFFP